MRIPIYQVDAFTDRVFAGNPAAVCPLEAWLPDRTLLAIAAENNLSETAFFVPRGSRTEIRWFTPAVEVDLCGHATLAAAYVICTLLEPAREEVLFESVHAGQLAVTRDGGRFVLDFPARPALACEAPRTVLSAMGGPAPAAVLSARDLMLVYDDEDAVRRLAPDLGLLARANCFAVIATAPGREVDFVSRFFAPAVGVPEDPVTGSAHCTLVPYWAARLGRTRLEARQVSARGGALGCTLAGDRVLLAGHAALYLQGELHLDR